MVKFAIFDIDGTLLDSNKVDAICYARSIVEEFEMESIDERWELYEHATDSGIFDEIFQRAFSREPSASETERHIKRLIDLLKEYCAMDRELFREIKGAGAMIKALKARPDWEIGIATGAWRESALFKLSAAGIDVDGVPIVTSSDTKTREDILNKCIDDSREFYGANEFAKIVSIGDAIWDVKTARNLQISFIGIGTTGDTGTFAGCTTAEDYSEPEQFMELLEKAEIPGD